MIKFVGGETFGDCLRPAMTVKTQEEADQYLKDYTNFILEERSNEGKPVTPDRAEQIAKSNIGYYAGYFSQETRVRVENLFNCIHPILGPASKPVTAEEAFKLGQEMAKHPEQFRNRLDHTNMPVTFEPLKRRIIWRDK